MRPALTSLCLAACLATPAVAQGPAQDARELARAVAEAAGLKAWSKVGVFRFSFVFAAKSIERSYVWDVRAGRVAVTQGDEAVEVRVTGPAPNERVTAGYVEAHQRFVNDSFWALPCLHLVWDEGTTLEDLGQVDVPGLPDLGKRRALSVRYDPEGGGYTPGDRYVYYLGDDLYPVAWAFHPQGAEEPRFVAEWRSPRDVGGLRVVEQYWAAGGALNLQIVGVEVEPAQDEAPTSRPASRPAGD